jgi:hypothetical protein
MKPSDMSAYLQQIATRLDNSKHPVKALVANDPGKLLDSVRIATDRILSVAISDLARDEIDKLWPGRFNWGWDARKGQTEAGFGFGKGSSS